MTYTPHTQEICQRCQKYHSGSKRVCRRCIRRYRPKLKWWIFFWLTVFTFIIPGIVYYIYIKEKQDEW